MTTGDVVIVTHEDGSEEKATYWFTTASPEEPKAVVLFLDSDGYRWALVWPYRIHPVIPACNNLLDMPTWASAS